MIKEKQWLSDGFSLVEVVLAIGIVGFAVLTTFGLLSVGHDTNKRARDDVFAAQLATNEFGRLRSLSLVQFPTVYPTYPTRYYDSDLKDLGTDKATAVQNGAVYEFAITYVTTPPQGTADLILNAEARYPVNAASSAQTKVQFTALMNSASP